ncbi:MAG: hypothetical protein V3T08_09695 [Gemmatimonadota bacterium]
MAVVHGNFQDLAVRLIRKNGRPVSIRRDLGSTPVDPSKPWLGKVSNVQDVPTIAAFLDNDKRDLLLMLPGQADQRTIVEADLGRRVFIAAKGLGFEITIADRLVDGDQVWEIKEVKVIKPGPTPVVFVLKVSN